VPGPARTDPTDPAAPSDPLETGLTPVGLRGLRSLLEHPESAVLAIDFDGTLSPIVADPAAAFAEPGATDALVRLCAHLGVVAILTGRPAAQAVQLAGLEQRRTQLGGLLVLGHYGLERWDARSARLVSPPPEPGVGQAREALPALLRELDVPADIEDKGSAVAVHVRRLPDPDAALARLREPITALADRCGLVVEPGRAVLELRPAGIDKGHALRDLVAGHDGAVSSVVMIGDDLGDVAAFELVAELRSTGTPGLLICSGAGEVAALAELADVVVADPAAVVAWLTALAQRLES
jgi:trehalose 6-phosphate phosphatase